MKRTIPARCVKALVCGLIGCLLLSMCGFVSRCEDISDRVVRLHILANSDSETDQALKLKVRDAVLAASDGLLDGVDSADAAKVRLQAALPQLLAVAQQCVYDNGSGYAVRGEVCDSYFTTRQYDTVTLPAGVYQALRITIGSGEGHNWWCVVFPPMCLSGASEQAALSEVLTAEEEAIVSQPQQYEVRFKLVEWWNDLCRAWS